MELKTPTNAVELVLWVISATSLVAGFTTLVAVAYLSRLVRREGLYASTYRAKQLRARRFQLLLIAGLLLGCSFVVGSMIAVQHQTASPDED
jgi:hypothetical protein